MEKNNIIRFPKKADTTAAFLKEAINIVESENIDNVMIAFKLKNETGYIMTGYHNLNMAEKQELLGHIQVDIIRDFIEHNYL